MTEPKKMDLNAKILLLCPVVLLIGAVLILYGKGYFSSRGKDTRKNESRFVKMAETAGEWKPEPPVELAKEIKTRIQYDMEKYKDPRFTSLEQQFNKAEKRHNSGELSSVDFQQTLVGMRNNIIDVEIDVDPELAEKSREFRKNRRKNGE